VEEDSDEDDGEIYQNLSDLLTDDPIPIKKKKGKDEKRM
jgi:hypothetical protein